MRFRFPSLHAYTTQLLLALRKNSAVSSLVNVCIAYEFFCTRNAFFLSWAFVALWSQSFQEPRTKQPANYWKTIAGMSLLLSPRKSFSDQNTARTFFAYLVENKLFPENCRQCDSHGRRGRLFAAGAARWPFKRDLVSELKPTRFRAFPQACSLSRINKFAVAFQDPGVLSVVKRPWPDRARPARSFPCVSLRPLSCLFFSHAIYCRLSWHFCFIAVEIVASSGQSSVGSRGPALVAQARSQVQKFLGGISGGKICVFIISSN